MSGYRSRPDPCRTAPPRQRDRRGRGGALFNSLVLACMLLGYGASVAFLWQAAGPAALGFGVVLHLPVSFLLIMLLVIVWWTDDYLRPPEG
jgi:hypothetical protein